MSATVLIIITTCVVSWMGFRSRGFEEKYIFWPEAVLAWKEYYRMVTSKKPESDLII